MELNELLMAATKRGASDVHLTPGEPPVYRLSGTLERQGEYPTLDGAEIERMLAPTTAGYSTRTLAEAPEFTFHVMPIRTQEGMAACVRVLLDRIPTLDQIGGDARAELEAVAVARRGLYLITGPTGSGKMTTGSAIVDHINENRVERIFVLENSPNYRWVSKQSMVTGLRIGEGEDYESFEQAAQMLLRGGDPDVVYFTDLPTQEAIRQALMLAETGHLVIANLHAESAAEAVASIAQSLPEPREAGREVLARTLGMVFGQRLLPRADRPGRVPAYEVLKVTPEVREIIREGAEAERLRETMVGDEAAGSRTMGQAIERLLAAGLITEEVAKANEG